MPLKPAEVLALEVATNRRQGELFVLAAGQVVEVRPDPVGQGAEDLVDPQRVGLRVRLQLLVLEPGQRLEFKAWLRTIFWIPRMRSSTEISMPGPAKLLLAPVYHRSVPKRRSKVGENWNDLSLRMASVRNFKHSRCFVPATGTIGSRASLSALWSRETDWPPIYCEASVAPSPH